MEIRLQQRYNSIRMAERTTTEAPKVDRRNAIKAVAVAVGAVALASREIHANQNGIETSIGIFYPLYEKHSVGLDPKNIPDTLDAFFREGMMRKEHYDLDTLLFLNALKNGTLEKLAQNNTKLIVGDTYTDASMDNSFRMLLATNRKQLIAAGVAGFGGYLYNHIKKMTDETKVIIFKNFHF